MKYIHTKSPIGLASEKTAEIIKEHLIAGERVLWLLSGGSSLGIAINTSNKLSGVNLSNLFVSLTDERYGPIGHKDENWQQLLDGGLLLPNANIYRPMIGENINNTTAKFNDWLKEQLQKANYKIGIFGMGPDGHTAGIKPQSPAVYSDDLVSSFKGDDYERVTISFTAIKQIDEAIIQISGNDKKPAVHQLIYENLPLVIQPAQILKIIPKSTIYSNIKEEEI